MNRLALLTAALFLTGCQTAEEKRESAFWEACAEAVQKRLLAPDTFEYRSTSRMNVVPYSHRWIRENTTKLDKRPTTPEGHQTRSQLEAIMRLNEQDGGREILTASFTYQSQNRLGVPIANSASCAVEYDVVRSPNAPVRETYIDGQTFISYITSL